MTGPLSPQRPAPAWKTVLALLSLALTGLLWIDGMVSSLERPSAVDALGLRQMELTVLAEEGLPQSIRPLLVGDGPRESLAKELARQIQSSKTPPLAIQRLELALLQRGSDQAELAAQADQQLRELIPSVDGARRPLLEALSEPTPRSDSRQAELLEPWAPSLLLRQLSCEQLGAPLESCPAQRQGLSLALRLVAISLGPAVLLLVGAVVLLVQLWRASQGQLAPAAPLLGPPITPVDATLLVAGAFVLLGEVLTPQLIQAPIQQLLASLSLPSATAQGLQVLMLYLGLMVAPLGVLLLLLAQLGPTPPQGWLQWRWRPPGSALLQALRALLMVLPAVAFAGWLVERLWNDPRGSNPLLEQVLTSGDGLALLCFAVTATLLAPLFEETLFRGVLMPVVGVQLGGAMAVLVSAAIFAMAHLSLNELTPLFVLGLGLGWLRWRTGRLACSVLMHALWNGLTLVNLWLLAD
ncbi:MAG: lysostaphin resistance A-like protein [Synechococcaceae cyanobacterium]